MSVPTGNQSEELRHERKFLITDHAASEVEQIIKFQSACFREIFHQRTINNIYLDSLSYDSYYGNVDGDTDRTKIRIRWYGDLFGEIKNAVLEFKIKKGLLGKKEYYELSPFRLDKDFSRQELRQALNRPSIPRHIADIVLSMNPALLNSYSRKYFLSADKRFRLTIDKDLTFYRISSGGNIFLNRVRSNDVVLELKYDVNFEEEAKEISSELPFRMTKNSKYVFGVEHVLF